MPEAALDSPIIYEMTDALITCAVREDCMANLREHATIRDLCPLRAAASRLILVGTLLEDLQ